MKSVMLAAVAVVVGSSMSSAEAQINTRDMFKELAFVGTVGLSSVSGYSDAGLGFKLGAETKLGTITNVPGLGIGATAYYAYTTASQNYAFAFSCEYETNAHSFAAGPTVNYALSNLGISLQGRAVGSWTRYNVKWTCGGRSFGVNGSGGQIDLGFGVGVQYALSKSISLRADYDDIGWNSGLFSIGANVRF